MSDEENEKKEANLEDTETSTLLLGQLCAVCAFVIHAQIAVYLVL